MKIDEILNDNIGSILGRMIATKAFWLIIIINIKNIVSIRTLYILFNFIILLKTLYLLKYINIY